MNKKKDTTGVWITLEPGVKQILDLICSGKKMFRKDYVTAAVEAAIIAEVTDPVIFRQAIATIDPVLSSSFAELEKRVFAHRSGTEYKPQKDEDELIQEPNRYNEELAEPIDLPHEVAPK